MFIIKKYYIIQHYSSKFKAFKNNRLHHNHDYRIYIGVVLLLRVNVKIQHIDITRSNIQTNEVLIYDYSNI